MTAKKTICCAECGSTDTWVSDSRATHKFKAGVVRRRRTCKECQHTFQTLEIPTADLSLLIMDVLREIEDGVSVSSRRVMLKFQEKVRGD